MIGRRRAPGSSDEICKDRLQSGQIDQCWRTMRRSPFVAPQTVAIETAWGGHYGQTPEELFWQGAAAAVMTDILEDAGYRVEVYANRVIEDQHVCTLFVTVLINFLHTESSRIEPFASRFTEFFLAWECRNHQQQDDINLGALQVGCAHSLNASEEMSCRALHTATTAFP